MGDRLSDSACANVHVCNGRSSESGRRARCSLDHRRKRAGAPDPCHGAGLDIERAPVAARFDDSHEADTSFQSCLETPSVPRRRPPRSQRQASTYAAIRPPTVPAGTSRLRVSLNARLDQDTLERFASTLETVLQRIDRAGACGVEGIGAHGAPARERRGASGSPQATEPGCGAEPHLR